MRLGRSPRLMVGRVRTWVGTLGWRLRMALIGEALFNEASARREELYRLDDGTAVRLDDATGVYLEWRRYPYAVASAAGYPIAVFTSGLLAASYARSQGYVAYRRADLRVLESDGSSRHGGAARVPHNFAGVAW